MKKILVLATLFVAIASFGQEAVKDSLISLEPTTKDEYNYITKGYKIQKESGLDMKKGYSFGSLSKTTAGKYKIEVWKLYKHKENSIMIPKAIMLIVNNAMYFCIPIENNELMNEYYRELQKYDSTFNQAISIATANALTKSIN